MTGPPRDPAAAIWHDVECGRYDADVGLWRELAAAAGGPVLDVGAGTGRIALDLARAGHEVVALDHDPALLAVLSRRAGAERLHVATVVGDAAGFELARRDFALVIAPMQTVQLLGPSGRRGFLRSARAHVAPGGRVAVALVEELEPFDADDAILPFPDTLVVDGAVYSSQPVAMHDRGATVAIERVREIAGPDGRRTVSEDVLQLDRIDVRAVEAEGCAAGLEPLATRSLPATDEHVGSCVVIWRG